jgi:hypothetical protein
MTQRNGLDGKSCATTLLASNAPAAAAAPANNLDSFTMAPPLRADRFLDDEVRGHDDDPSRSVGYAPDSLPARGKT